MVESQKRLIVEQTLTDNFKWVSCLAGSKKAETLYLVNYNEDNVEGDVYELATSAEELTKIRDFMIDLVSKIENNYGIEQSVKYVEGK